MSPRPRPAGRRALLVLAAAALPLLSWQLLTRAYAFPEPAPFRGPSLYNPYRDADFSPGGWKRANFHAHSRAWGGLTGGRRVSVEDLREGYGRLGYDVAQVSDYMSIRPGGEGPGEWIPAYEHGYGATQAHQLCIGASRVDWFEFPLFQTTHHRQTVIDRQLCGEHFVKVGTRHWPMAVVADVSVAPDTRRSWFHKISPSECSHRLARASCPLESFTKDRTSR